MKLDITHTKALPSFSVIVAKPGANIYIESSSENSIAIISEKTNITPKYKECFIVNDTLYVSKNSLKKQFYIKGNTIKTIIGKEAKIYLSNLETDSLSIFLNNGTINGNLSVKTISHVEILAKNNSDINIQKGKINSLSLTLNRSKMLYFGARSEVQHIILKNSSILGTHSSKELIINSDESSTYAIYSN
jgi:hypothetical protein